jgi:hypothetical protein
MKTKVQRFVDAVVNSLQTPETNPWTVRYDIGDSLERQRTPSVQQLVRYNTTSPYGDTRLGTDLSNVKQYLLDTKLLRKVRRNSPRSDAYTLTEFVVALNSYVVNNETRRKEVNTLISNY